MKIELAGVALFWAAGGPSHAAAAASSTTAPYVPQTVPTTVVALTRDNFQTALQDAVNPLWLLKFYAPWCGHCKQLAPILDQVAPVLQGKMSIGTIDCTQQKQLCDQHDIKGYPTLKFALDGEIHDYPMGRTAADIVGFANKFHHPQVQVVSSKTQAMEYMEAEQVTEGVGFVAYHPSANTADDNEKDESSGSSSLEDTLQSAELTRIYQKVARKMMAFGSFLLYQGNDAATEFAQPSNDAPFLCRLEANVPIRCYDQWEADLTLENVLRFCQINNVPTVARLTGQNFQKIGRNGRPVVIGVVDADDREQVDLAKSKLTNFALSGPEAVRNKYYYGWIDGKLFQKFLKQFNVEPTELPQVIVLDVPRKQYWQNATYQLNVEDFVQAVEDRTIPRQTAGKKGLEGALERFMTTLIDNRPWSVAALVFGIGVFCILVLMVLSPAQDLQPPYKQPVKVATADATPAKNSSTSAVPSEPKKDK